jgi:hypothetical protein
LLGIADLQRGSQEISRLNEENRHAEMMEHLKLKKEQADAKMRYKLRELEVKEMELRARLPSLPMQYPPNASGLTSMYHMDGAQQHPFMPGSPAETSSGASESPYMPFSL